MPSESCLTFPGQYNKEFLSSSNLALISGSTDNLITNSVSNSSDEDSCDLSSQGRVFIINNITKVTKEEDTSYLDELLS